MIDRRKSLDKLYTDICDIYENTDEETEHSITKQKWHIVHENIKCALSKKTLNNVNQTEGEAVIVNSMVLFLDDRVNILKGSKIKCRGQIFYAGEPFVYEGSHQEVPLITKEYA